LIHGLERVPQGLKPAFFSGLNGTLRLRSGQALKAVPYPKTVYKTSSSNNPASSKIGVARTSPAPGGDETHDYSGWR